MEEFFIKNIQNNLHKVLALISGIGLVIIFFSLVDNFISIFVPQIYYRLAGYLFAEAIWVVYWLIYKYGYPKNRRNKIGLVVAIYAEKITEEIILKNDFIKQLQKSIYDEGFGNLIQIIVLKNHLSEKIKGVDDVQSLKKRIKGHYYLWGNIKKRKDGEEKYFLNLDGLVIHRPINVNVSRALSTDFIKTLPKEISFQETFQLRGFKFSAEIVYLSVKYITGLAAYLSGDPFTAIKLHTNLKEEFNKSEFKPLPDHIRNIRDRAVLILSNEKVSVSRYYFRQSDIPKAKQYLTEALQLNPNNYSGWLLKAIYDFKIDSNVSKSLESIKRAKRYCGSRGEWRYSRAFLFFWEGRFSEALSDCIKIAKSSYIGEDITVYEVEQFNLDLLKTVNKPQLYFWIGFLNYRKSSNLPQSLVYLEKFLEQADNTMDILKQKAGAYLVEIKKQMTI
ncbi:hypothetical protein C4572_00145 [Candidatus Parcubacteria bacterium]|nr:MAG: hypothetical protein C4572_00145 [Candidatus Parcubacteria bacterium]